MKKLYLYLFSILAFLFLTAQTCTFPDMNDVQETIEEAPEEPTSFTGSYESCLESHESASSSSIQTIIVGLKRLGSFDARNLSSYEDDWADLEDFVSDYNIKPDDILKYLKMVEYTVESGTQAEWICLFLEDDRVIFAELEQLESLS